MPPSANTALPAGARRTCKTFAEAGRASYSMQDTQPSTSVPSNASWRNRM